MKNRLLALAVLSAMAAAPASAGVFTVDFEPRLSISPTEPKETALDASPWGGH